MNTGVQVAKVISFHGISVEYMTVHVCTNTVTRPTLFLLLPPGIIKVLLYILLFKQFQLKGGGGVGSREGKCAYSFFSTWH